MNFENPFAPHSQNKQQMQRIGLPTCGLQRTFDQSACSGAMTLMSAQHSAVHKSDCSNFAFHSLFDRWTVHITYNCEERF